MPAYRYDYDPDAQPQESMELRQGRKEVARTSRAANIRKMTEQVAAPARQLEQQLGIGRPVMRQMGEPSPRQTMGEALGAEPGHINGRPNQPMRQQMAQAAPAKAPPMSAQEAADHFLREARQQMDVLNAGRRNGSIDANLDKQMMGQINHLLNLHNEAKASIMTMPKQAPQPQGDSFLAEARRQIEILNAGRRDGSIDANLDRQMMQQINNLMRMHNESQSAPAAAPAPQPVKGAGMWQQPRAAPQAQPQAAPKPAPKAPAKQAQSKRPKMYRDFDPNERSYDMNRIGLPPEDLGPSYLRRTGRNAYTRNRRTEQG